MNLYRWQPALKENLGDWLSVPILRALGHEPQPPVAGEPCLFAVGSILRREHYEACPGRPIVVWGSGIGRRHDRIEAMQFRAVRGPLTRDALALPEETPLGDPALLLPRLVTLPAPLHRGEILFVNHCLADSVLCPDGCDAGVTTIVDAEKALALVARIAAARFVASESLHGCILAAAYGVPWAFCSPRWATHPPDGLPKYRDWFLYLGLTPPELPCPDLASARRWWERAGRHGRLRDLRSLAEAFPKD